MPVAFAVSEKARPYAFIGAVQEGIFKPNGMQSGQQCLSKRYDMSRPGEYTIQAFRGISANPKDGVVESNIINVTVAP